MSRISDDRNDPETVYWLDVCRKLSPQLEEEVFEALIPEFIKAGQQLEAAQLMRELH